MPVKKETWATSSFKKEKDEEKDALSLDDDDLRGSRPSLDHSRLSLFPSLPLSLSLSPSSSSSTGKRDPQILKRFKELSFFLKGEPFVSFGGFDGAE